MLNKRKSIKKLFRSLFIVDFLFMTIRDFIYILYTLFSDQTLIIIN